MRPTPEGVGNLLALGAGELALDASMRPTPEGVGNKSDLLAIQRLGGVLQ